MFTINNKQTPTFWANYILVHQKPAPAGILIKTGTNIKNKIPN